MEATNTLSAGLRWLALVALIVASDDRLQAQTRASQLDSAAIDAYVEPYITTNNFSGQLLVARGGKVLYERNVGWADAQQRRPITANTGMHIASISMQFTAAAIMRLIDERRLALDTRVEEVLPSLSRLGSITIRNLLEQRSGMSDVNARADYDSILQRHQTPASLVAYVSDDTLRFAPGSKYVREEHSAYNLLALIIEKRTGMPFASAVQQLVFRPLGMSHSGVDDDSAFGMKDVAHGYAPQGVYQLAPATPIHWSAKSGNASVYTTARDEARWVQRLFHGTALRSMTRAVVTDTTGVPAGYGWFRRQNNRFEQFTYSMSGRAPGFASYVMYLPREDLTVIALSNIYSSATGDIGNDIAAIATGRPYTKVALDPNAVSPREMGLTGERFTFPSDFYQPNAVLAFEERGNELFLKWPTGDRSPIILIDRDHAIDRAYWEPIAITRDSAGRPAAITFDRFRGERTP